MFFTARKAPGIDRQHAGRGGFPVTASDVLTAPVIAAAYLHDRYPGARYLMVNSGDIAEDLVGLTLAREGDQAPADVVLIGGAGPEFSYQALNQAFSHLQRGARLVAMHRSLFWRISEGLQLDTGAFLAGLEQAAGTALAAFTLVTAGAAGAAPGAARSPAAAGTGRPAGAPGSQLWVRLYDGPGNSFDAASSVVVSPGGSRVFVTGESQGTRLGVDYATVAYSAVTGARLWAARYNGPGNSNDAASSVAVSPGGSRVFVTGESQGTRFGPGLRHGGVQRRHRRPAVGDAVQRPGQLRRRRSFGCGEPRREDRVRHGGKQPW